MPRKKYTAEQIIAILRDAEILNTMARRIKDGLMMRMDLMELLCLSPGKSVHPPDGHDVAQMVFIL